MITYPDLQSARKAHSTETALIQLVDDIGSALDDKLEVALVLIDLSSAFDTVDHQILLNRLRVKFGISGLVLAWFESYLTARQQTVNIDGTRSSSIF